MAIVEKANNGLNELVAALRILEMRVGYYITTLAWGYTNNKSADEDKLKADVIRIKDSASAVLDVLKVQMSSTDLAHLQSLVTFKETFVEMFEKAYDDLSADIDQGYYKPIYELYPLMVEIDSLVNP